MKIFVQLKLLASSTETTDIHYGFENNNDRKREKLTNNKEALQKRPLF